MGYTFNLSTWEAETGKFEASLLYIVLGQLEPHSETLSEKKQKNQQGLSILLQMTEFHGFYDLLVCMYHIFFSHSSFSRNLHQFHIFTISSELLYVWINGF